MTHLTGSERIKARELFMQDAQAMRQLNNPTCTQPASAGIHWHCPALHPQYCKIHLSVTASCHRRLSLHSHLPCSVAMLLPTIAVLELVFNWFTVEVLLGV